MKNTLKKAVAALLCCCLLCGGMSITAFCENEEAIEPNINEPKETIFVKEEPGKALFLNSQVLCVALGLKPDELLALCLPGAVLSEESDVLKTGMKLTFKLEEGEYTVTLLVMGDIDCNGAVTSADARLALRAAVGLENLSPIALSAAKVNDDDLVSADDARLVLRAAVGLEKLRLRVITVVSPESEAAFDTVKNKLMSEGTKDAEGAYALLSPLTSALGMGVCVSCSYFENAEKSSQSLVISAQFDNGITVSVTKYRESNMASLKFSYEFSFETQAHFIKNDVIMNATELSRSTKSFSTKNLSYSANSKGREESAEYASTWLYFGIPVCDEALYQATGINLFDLGFLLYKSV